MGGDKEKAYEIASEIKKRDPKKGHEAYNYIYSNEKKYDLAEKEYFELIKTDSDNVDFHNRLAWFYVIIKDYRKAHVKLIKIIKKFPEEPLPYYTAGYVGFMSGKYLKHAEECMMKFFEIISTDMKRSKFELA